ncbi:hypothetical protein K466DRAFT_655701 [Polyporus arcularius HHB13444]|uniref:Uncharacterized protein n=1 Tax=Polyporus arcularius HHB13444 TaxID=1314778 RepID=A0A5C3NYN7_9APHY|nr:hypothetical protein K466DRAFT_655701 [Polyporus arcularius HHB13444]
MKGGARWSRPLNGTILPVVQRLGNGSPDGCSRASASYFQRLVSLVCSALYAVAYLIHKRYRLWRRQVLPRLTMLKLPEMYGALALGHAANIQADRLIEKLLREGDENRLYIHQYSVAMARNYHEVIRKMSNPVERMPSDVAYPGVLQSPEIRGGLLESLYNMRWQLRSRWSDGRSRFLASHSLDPHIRQLGLSDHDARLLVWYVAERIYTSHYYRVGTGNARRCRESPLPSVGVRSLWGRYRHWKSLWSLEDPVKAKAVVKAAVDAHDAEAEKARKRKCS